MQEGYVSDESVRKSVDMGEFEITTFQHELVPKREETIGAIGYIPKGTSQAKTAFHTLFFGKYSFNIRSSILLSEIPVSLICALCY